MSNPSNSQLEEGCCGTKFKFTIENLSEISNVTFYAVPETKTIIVVYIKDGALYFSISYDCGHTFEDPRRVMDIAGTVKDIQIQTKGDQFVVALKLNDGKSKEDIKKAISGWLHNDQTKFFVKECIPTKKEKPPGSLVNTSVSFRNYFVSETNERGEESVDNSFYLDDDGYIRMDCEGHRCVIK
jgi:hypothetical protein